MDDAKITLVLHHGGRFIPREGDGNFEYVNGEFDVWEDLSADLMNTFLLRDLVLACKNYSNIGDCYWLIDKELDFNRGLRNFSTDGDIIYLVRDVMENDNEVNVYFHHEVDPIAEEVSLPLEWKCPPILEVSNGDDSDEVEVEADEVEEDGVGDSHEQNEDGAGPSDADNDEWVTDFSCMRKEVDAEYETDGYHLEEMKNPMSSDDEDDYVQKVFPQFNENSQFGDVKLEVGMEFSTFVAFKSALRDYSIFLGREFNRKKNDK